MNFTAANTQFYAASTLVVTGTNPEMADYDNPRGEIITEVWFIVAANDHGDTRESGSFGDGMYARVDAEKTAEALTARATNLGKLPVGFDDWHDGRAVYGSDAYVEYGQAEDLEWERSCA